VFVEAHRRQRQLPHLSHSGLAALLLWIDP